MTVFTLNATQIQKELNVTENGAERAMSETPKASETELDIHQQNIVDHVANSLDDMRHAALEELGALDTVRNNIEKEVESFSLSRIHDSAKHKVIRLHAESHELLGNAREEEAGVQRNYRYFLYQNKLRREPSYPTSMVLHWALVIAAVLIESAINSFFFADISDLGLLGGLFISLFISISNIGSAVIVGKYVLPWKNHVDEKKQSRTKLIMWLYVPFIFVFNLGAAHYRTLIEEDLLNAKMNAIPHMIHDPLGINFEAWNLLVIGMLFVIIAMLKGYKSDDVYPGYGEMHRKLKSASNHRELRINAMKSVNRIIDEHTRMGTGSAENARQQIRNFKSSITQSEGIAERFGKVVESAENVCNNVLWKYREANVRVRSSKPPKYFSEKYSFHDYRLAVDLAEAKAACNRIEARLNEIQKEEEDRLNDGLREINEKALEDISEFFSK